MNKSLEALNKICKVKIYQKEASAYDYLGKEIYKDEINTIKQDLERLEALQKDYNEIDFRIDQVCIVNDNLQKQNDFLEQENEKLKKAIEILSNYICVRNPLDEEDTYYLSALFSNEEIDKQTHDLLKEVLNDE